LAEKCQENPGLGTAEFHEGRIILFPCCCIVAQLFRALEKRGALPAGGNNHFVNGKRLLFCVNHGSLFFMDLVSLLRRASLSPILT
jgi:hypothetical protein